MKDFKSWQGPSSSDGPCRFLYPKRARWIFVGWANPAEEGPESCKKFFLGLETAPLKGYMDLEGKYHLDLLSGK